MMENSTVVRKFSNHGKDETGINFHPLRINLKIVLVKGSEMHQCYQFLNSWRFQMMIFDQFGRSNGGCVRGSRSSEDENVSCFKSSPLRRDSVENRSLSERTTQMTFAFSPTNSHSSAKTSRHIICFFIIVSIHSIDEYNRSVH